MTPQQDTGRNKNATSIVVLQGYVMNIGNGQTMVVCPTSGRFDVKWKNDTMPNIKRGEYITLAGKLITLDLGRSFIVVRAELMKAKSLKDVKKYIQERTESHERRTAAAND